MKQNVDSLKFHLINCIFSIFLTSVESMVQRSRKNNKNN